MPVPDSTRYARDAADAIGARFEDLDNGEGYLFRISRGGHFVLGGGGNVCSYPVNSAPAYTISRDKAHTKAVLAACDIPVIPGGLWFAHGRRAALRGPGREARDAAAFAERLGYPVFCKPNNGSRGIFAEVVRDAAELEDYIRGVAVEFEAFLIEPVLDGAEHRVFVLDGRPIFHATKSTPALVGDGRSTLAQLLADLNAQLQLEGISATPASALGGHDLTATPAPGERIPLPGRRNLSASGGIETFSERVPAPLAHLAIAAVAALGLRAGAVDLFDLSAARDLSDNVVIEVNGNPGLRTLELAGRTDLIRAIWVHMLDACLNG
ncbi:MAG: hypothetical protein ABMA14_28565 [Hyphomonadaceae bacterium]